MNSLTLPEFWDLYRRLPESVRRQARRAYVLFEQDHQHPSLRFRQVHPTRPIFSARVGSHHRAVGIVQGQEILWFWIGSHSDYDQLLRQI